MLSRLFVAANVLGILTMIHGCQEQAEIPVSSSVKKTVGQRELGHLYIAVTAKEIRVNDDSLLTLPDSDGRIPEGALEEERITVVYSTVKTYRDAYVDFANKSEFSIEGNPFVFDDVVQLTIDDTLPYETFEHVVNTLDKTGFKTIDCKSINKATGKTQDFVISKPSGVYNLPDPVPVQPFVNVAFLIHEARLTVVASEFKGWGIAEPPQAVFEQELNGCYESVERLESCLDWAALNQLFQGFKDINPAERFYVLNVKEDVPLYFVTRLVETVRWFPMVPSNNDESSEEWSTWIKTRQVLFDRPLIDEGAQ